MRLVLLVGAGGLAGLVSALACDAPARCGPAEAVVARVVDGDTIELTTGDRVRYLAVDTPEITGGENDCYGAEARDFNRQLVEGRHVSLIYDVECEDAYGRLLAYVELDGREVNGLLVERGLACVLVVPPNAEDRREELEALEATARNGGIGMWGACEVVACD